MTVRSGPSVGGGPSTLRRILGRVEALWWLMRPNSAAVVVVIGGIGWFTSRGAGLGWSFAWSVLTIVLGTGLIHIINDVSDEAKDRVTAPYLPLPAGLVGRHLALGTAILGMPLVLLLLVLIVGPSHAERVALALGLITLIVGLTLVYSAAKKRPLLGSTVATVPLVSLALLGWISGGAARPHLLAAMVPYLACLAFAGTITAAFRDLDLDAVVGNHTLPVVLGGPAALRLAAGLEATGLLVVVVTAIALDEAAGLWYCALAGAVLAAAYRPYSRRLGEPDRGRRARIADGFPWAIGGLLKSVAMIVVLTGVPHVGWVAVGAASFVAIWRTLRRLYDARIVKGGLAVRLGIPHPAH